VKAPQQSKYTLCECPAERQIGIEYPYDDPLHYDGVSEWNCRECGRRWCAWTKRELLNDEQNPRFGGVLK
jgi:hypothetical protein